MSNYDGTLVFLTQINLVCQFGWHVKCDRSGSACNRFMQMRQDEAG